MSCILTIGGKNFDVDAFVQKSKLVPYKRSYKGQPKFKTKPNREKLSSSFLSLTTSKASFNNLKQQISDTIRYLKRNRNKLVFISSTKGIDYATLDFGIDLRIDKKKVLYQSDTFPSNLLKLAGDLGLDIELSIYPVELETILAKRLKMKKSA